MKIYSTTGEAGEIDDFNTSPSIQYKPSGQYGGGRPHIITNKVGLTDVYRNLKPGIEKTAFQVTTSCATKKTSINSKE
jgi:hypothetical protein